jgi:hypothetical protein
MGNLAHKLAWYNNFSLSLKETLQKLGVASIAPKLANSSRAKVSSPRAKVAKYWLMQGIALGIFIDVQFPTS